MAHRIKRGTFNTRTSPGFLSVTGTGFKPGFVMFFQRGSNASAGVDGMGFADRYGENHAIANVISGVEAYRVGRSVRSIVRTNTSGTFTSSAAVSSFDSNGFTLNFTTATTAYGWDYLAFEEDIQSKIVYLGNPSTGVKNLDFGFRPSALIVLLMHNDANQAIGRGFGFIDSEGRASFTQFRSGVTDYRTNSYDNLLTFQNTNGVGNIAKADFLEYTDTGANISVDTFTSTAGWGIAIAALGPQLSSKVDVFVNAEGASRAVGFKPSAVIAERRPVAGTTPSTWQQSLGWSDNSLSQHSYGTFQVGSYTGNWANTFVRANASGREALGTITAYTDDGYNTTFSGTSTTWAALALGDRVYNIDGVNEDPIGLTSPNIRLSQRFTTQPSAASVGVTSSSPTLVEGPPKAMVYAPGFGGGFGGVITTYGAVQHPILAASELEVQSSLHNTVSPNISISQAHILTPISSVISHKSDNLPLSQVHKLIVGNSVTSVTSGELSVVQAFSLPVDKATHILSSPDLNLASAGSLGIESAIHSVKSLNVLLSQAHNIEVNKSLIGLTSSVIGTIQNSQVNPNSSIIGHLAQSIGVTQNHKLFANSTLHGAKSDAITLEQIHTLIVSKALHGPTSDELALIQFTLLNTPHRASHKVLGDIAHLIQNSELSPDPSTIYTASPEVYLINWDKLNVNFGNYVPKISGDGTLNTTGVDGGNLAPKSHGDGELQVVFTTDGYLIPREKPDGRY